MSARFSAESANWEPSEKSGADGGAKSEKNSGGAGRHKKDGAALLSGLLSEQPAAGPKGSKAPRVPLPVGELFVRRGPDALPEQERERKKKIRKKKTEGKITTLDETVDLEVADLTTKVPEAPGVGCDRR